jgi:hypothetical protein
VYLLFYGWNLKKMGMQIYPKSFRLGMEFHEIDPQLRVGAGLIGCVREGPGVRFTKASAPVNSVAVTWGRCYLPETCSGRTSIFFSFSYRKATTLYPCGIRSHDP